MHTANSYVSLLHRCSDSLHLSVNQLLFGAYLYYCEGTAVWDVPDDALRTLAGIARLLFVQDGFGGSNLAISV